MKKNISGQVIGAQLITAADGTAFTGAVSVFHTVDGGTQTSGGGTAPTHEGNGFHTYTPLQIETNGNHIAFTFTGTGAIPATIQVYTNTPQSEDNATRLADVPTVTEFEARTLLAADYFDPAVDVVDVGSVSGDISSANNLRDTYNGTGYTDQTAPATQLQVGRLATGSPAISVSASTAVVTTGTEVNSYLSTFALDGIMHEISDDGGAIDFYYEFDIGLDSVATDATATGRMFGTNDTLSLFAYNWDATSWEQIGLVQGSNNTDNVVSKPSLMLQHTGTGANAGLVRIRGYTPSGLTNATIFLDQAFISYSVVSDNVSITEILEDTNELQTNQGDWATAIGFSTFNPAVDVVANVTLVDTTTDVTNGGSGATEAQVQAIVDGLNDFNPAVDVVANVTLVDTTTDITNGGSGGATEAQVQAIVDGLNDFNPAIDVVANVTLVDTTTDITNGGSGGATEAQVQAIVDGLNDFDHTTDVVANVTLVDTTTTNTDMVGTDNALLATSYTAPDNIGIADTEAKVDLALTGITSTISKVDEVLVDTGVDIPALINALENLSAAEVKTEIVSALYSDATIEPTSVPSSTAPITDKLGYLFAFAANKLTQTATLQTIRNEGDTADISTAPMSSNVSTTTRGKHT